jgi:hypothetical protein
MEVGDVAPISAPGATVEGTIRSDLDLYLRVIVGGDAIRWTSRPRDEGEGRNTGFGMWAE